MTNEIDELARRARDAWHGSRLVEGTVAAWDDLADESKALWRKVVNTVLESLSLSFLRGDRSARRCASSRAAGEIMASGSISIPFAVDLSDLTDAMGALALTQGKIMAAIDDLKSAVDAMTAEDAALKASVDAAVAKINDLAAQIASASGNDAAITALTSQIAAETANLSADKASLDNAVTPPPPAPAAPVASEPSPAPADAPPAPTDPAPSSGN